MKGPMAGALFENFCIQETIKVFTARGESLRLFYLRTKTGLEVDLLVEGPGPKLHPFEFKLSATPRVEMAYTIQKFHQQFTALNRGLGSIVSLAKESRPLSSDVELLSLHKFLAEVVDKGMTP
jgi:predicted AAA+ superfamily ATPase